MLVITAVKALRKSGAFFVSPLGIMASKQVRNGLIVAGILALLYYISKRTINKISVGSPAVRIHTINLNGIELRVDLPIMNESDIPVDVTAFLGQLLYGASSLGTLTLVRPASLPGFGQSIIEFSLKSGLVGSAYELLNILTKGDPMNMSKIDWSNVDTSQFSVKGTLKVGRIPIDINTKLLG